MTPITRDQAWALARHFEATLGARIVQRTDAVEYQLVRHALQSATIGIVDIEQILENFSQTLGPLVYLSPKHVEDPETLAAVIVHEAEHVHQWNRDHLRLPWLYLTTQEGRATYEAHAYASQFEWLHARTGQIPESIDALGVPLEAPAYLLGDEEIKLARSLLVQRMTSTVAGHYAGHASRSAIDWAKQHAPELLVK